MRSFTYEQFLVSEIKRGAKIAPRRSKIPKILPGLNRVNTAKKRGGAMNDSGLEIACLDAYDDEVKAP